MGTIEWTETAELEKQTNAKEREVQKMDAEERIIQTIIDRFILETELTDEQKEIILKLYDRFDGNFHKYTKGDKFLYQEKVYEVVQSHTSEPHYQPDEIKALYTLFVGLQIGGAEVIPEWVQPQGTVGAYTKGQKVRHKGTIYVTVFNGLNVWEPGVYGWEVVS